MPTCPLFQLLHWGVWQITGRLGQGTFKSPLPIHLHSATTGHPLDPNQFNIMHKEVHTQSRTIKEAMFIHVQDPPSIATLANINYHTFGTNFFSLHQSFSASQLNSQPPLPTLNPLLVTHLFPFPNPSFLPLLIKWGGIILFPFIFHYGKYMHPIPTPPLSLSTPRSTAAPSW